MWKEGVFPSAPATGSQAGDCPMCRAPRRSQANRARKSRKRISPKRRALPVPPGHVPGRPSRLRKALRQARRDGPGIRSRKRPRSIPGTRGMRRAARRCRQKTAAPPERQRAAGGALSSALRSWQPAKRAEHFSLCEASRPEGAYGRISLHRPILSPSPQVSRRAPRLRGDAPLPPSRPSGPAARPA